MPPLCLMNSSTNFHGENHYPETLMKLWKKDIIGNPQTPPAASKNGMSHSLPDEMEPQNFAEFGDFDIEKMMAAEEGLYMASNGIPGGSTSSGSHGETSQFVPSSETDHNPHTFGRFTRRQNSLSIGNLDTVAEDIIMADLAPLKETGPTQTPLHGAPEHSINKVTESIRLQLKSHFDTPGNSQTESLNQLAEGLPRKRAALLFYQTCVMATMDFVKVEQKVPFGDIVISRGPKM